VKSNTTYTAMRVKEFDAISVVEVRCINEREKEKTDCLLIFNTIDDVKFLGADNFHPLIKAEMKKCALDAIAIGKGKLQIEAEQRVSELESSRLRQANIARQFREAVLGWSEELSSLNWDVQQGLDIPTLRTRITTVINSMEKLKPRK